MRRRILAPVIALALGTLPGCGEDAVVVCTAILIYGLDITVADSAGRPICDATVTVTDGAYRETLQGSPMQNCHYLGAPERRGRYQVAVQRAGYVSESRGVDVLGGDECHVATVPVAFVLRAAE